MATILTKKSDTASVVPATGDLTHSSGGAELAVNTADKRLFTKNSGGTVVEVGTNPSTLTTATLSVTGNTTLGDASGDSVTINASTVSTPNGLNFDSNTLVIDATNNRVGVGNSSPSQTLDVAGTARFNSLTVDGASNRYIFITSSDGLGECELRLGDAADNDAGAIAYDNATDSMQFRTNAAERMRIDSSGNLLVGKTSSSGATAGAELRPAGDNVFTRSSGQALTLRRNTSDGSILDFNKDGTTVGSIGAISGDTFIQTGGYGIRFSDAAQAIRPCTSTGAANTTMDIGDSTVPWRSLYLSGGVYVGGTTSANHLDDYEEGTWTPAWKGVGGTDPTVTYTNRWGSYTKIGNRVFFEVVIQTSTASGGSGTLGFTLPFQVSGGTANYHVCVVGYSTSLNTVVKTGYTDPGATAMYLTAYNAGGGNLDTTALTASPTSGYVMAQGHYEAA